MQPLSVGLIVNPVAGIGGPVGLKGSDGDRLQAMAKARGGQYKAARRCEMFLQQLQSLHGDMGAHIHWRTLPAPMGAQCLSPSQWLVDTVDLAISSPTSARDTYLGALALQDAGVDLLVFVGGDGTAREICRAVGQTLPVLGIPAGVKMHSGVFAVSPRAGALLLSQLVFGGLVAPVLREVRDYDDQSTAADAISVRTYGELCVPEVGGYIQQTKIGGKESEPLALEEICAEVLERLPQNRPIVLGPGSTCLAIKQALGLPGTLRGCDVRLADGSFLIDVTAAQIEALVHPYLIVSFSRGQGFLFGRGNQQLSAAFLQHLAWPDDVCVVATRTKLSSLEQRPLLIDTGDTALDDRLSGLIRLCTGYEDQLLYRVSV